MQVEVDASSANGQPFQAPVGPNGTDAITTAANGSGSFVFTKWHNSISGLPGTRVLSGTIKWTCSLT